MSLTFKNETFRDDFTYANSPEAIRRFPFPFDRDDYMYAVNLEPHTPGRKGSVFEHAFDVDEHYLSEMRDRALVLAEDPLRCQSLPHMTLAGWDLLELIMDAKARDYPQWFSLARDGNRWHWINRPMRIDQRFTYPEIWRKGSETRAISRARTPRHGARDRRTAAGHCGGCWLGLARGKSRCHGQPGAHHLSVVDVGRGGSSGDREQRPSATRRRDARTANGRTARCPRSLVPAGGY